MDADQVEKIKRLSVIGMFSDDDLMNMLVLKGANALDIVYGISPRASLDLDFSIPTEFNPGELASIQSKMEKALTRIFKENGYCVFDVKLGERPEDAVSQAPPFWGGYLLEFKIIESEEHDKMVGDPQRLRVSAVDIGPGSRKTYKIEISKYECCEQKRQAEIDGYTVYVYTPEMIVMEKLRAICQQMPEYSYSIGKSYTTARARDFFDIYTVVEYFNIDLTSTANVRLLKDVFAAKDVPLNLISRIKDYREYHRPDFAAVQDTVKPNVTLKDFDFYFDYVVAMSVDLAKSLGEV